MLSYEIDGDVLTLRVTGVPTDIERTTVYAAIRSDSRVPAGAFLLLDVRKSGVRASVPGSSVRLTRPPKARAFGFSKRYFFAGAFPASTGLRSNGPLLSTKNRQSDALSHEVVCR
jgi:hypothetical protein